MSELQRHKSRPDKCPKCKSKGTIKETPAAYWCSNVNGCTWTGAKTPPPRTMGGPVVERRDY